MIISIIAAVSENNVIGLNNDLVWNLPTDMKFFKEKTRGHHVLMGRRNFESIPEKFRPLPYRTNIVVTRKNLTSENNVRFVNEIEKGIEIARQNNEEELFIIGGGNIYKQTMDIADKLYLTRVHADFEGDTFFPDVDETKWKEESSKLIKADANHKFDFTFLEYSKK